MCVREGAGAIAGRKDSEVCSEVLLMMCALGSELSSLRRQVSGGSLREVLQVVRWMGWIQQELHRVDRGPLSLKHSQPHATARRQS